MILDFTYRFVNIPVFVNLLYKYSKEGLILTLSMCCSEQTIYSKIQ